jgi:phage/plasmid-associated DNA primase
VTGIEFVPPGSSVKLPEGAHNLWQGFAVEPKEGEAYKPLLKHLYNYVCHRDGDLYRWLVAWLANLIQEPGHKPGVAIALHGEQGAGKTILYRYLESIFGGHAAAVDSPSLVVGNFNAHMAGLCLLGVEEGFWAGDPKAESKLKNLITAESIMMEQKGVDAIKIASHVHIMVTSNAAWVVPVASDDRRWAVFHVDPTRRSDESYWKPIYAALDGDGPANLLRYLQGYHYDRALLFRPPMTKAKAEQATESMDSVGQWWLDVLRGDRDPAAGRFSSMENESRPDGVFETDTSKETLYKDYLAWCDGARRFRAVTSIHFWPKLRKLVGQSFKETRPSGEIRQRVAWFPPREVCQEHFAAMIGCHWSDLND